MAKKIPEKLYKYQSFNDYSNQNLRQNEIWFSKPDKLNDPFDCAITFNINGTDEEYQELYNILVSRLTEPRKLEKMKEIESKFLTKGIINSEFRDYTNNKQLELNRKKINNYNSQLGIACFSKTFDNILMWSHYADGHKGLCLEFDTNYFPFLNREKLHQVIYSSSYPSFSPAAVFQNEYMPIDPLITKFKDWKYECEWRFIKGEGNSALEYEPKALSAIYFGCSTPADQIKYICSLPAKSAARLYKMQLSDTEYKLIPRKLQLS